METERLSSIKNQIYIPKQQQQERPTIPSHHPSLIMSDSQSDITHHKECGCAGSNCIKEKAWFYGPNGEVKSQSTSSVCSTDAVAAQRLYNNSQGRLI